MSDQRHTDQRVVVRAISWRDLLPWLIILRSFRASVAAPALILAMAGVLATPIGWRISAALFVSEDALKADESFGEVVTANNRWPVELMEAKDRYDFQNLHGLWDIFAEAPSALVTVFRHFADPFVMMFQPGLAIWQLAYLVFGNLWMIAVWAVCAGAILRKTGIEIGREERCTMSSAATHSFKKFGSYFITPILPLLAMSLFAVPIALGGLLMLSDYGTVAAGVMWPLALLCGFVACLLLLGLLFGWPLMWAAIASESSNSFDALSRGYAYTYQRPLHYLFYVVLAMALGAAGWVLVSVFSEALIDVTYWCASWGANVGAVGGDGDRLQDIRALTEKPLSEQTGAIGAGAVILRFFDDGVRTLAIAFLFSFFWCSASTIYLALRRDVDQTEFDEIVLDDELNEHGLPPLSTDENNIPGPPETEDRDSDTKSDGEEAAQEE